MARFAFHAIGLSVWMALALLAAWFTPIRFQGAVGVFGSVASVVGLVYALFQLALTKSAAEAAHAAATRTARKIRLARLANLLSRILETLREVDAQVVDEAWPNACIRLEILSTHLIDLSCQYSPEADQVWTDLAKNTSDWSKRFADATRGRPVNSSSWRALRKRIQDKATKEYRFLTQGANDND